MGTGTLAVHFSVSFSNSPLMYSAHTCHHFSFQYQFIRGNFTLIFTQILRTTEIIWWRQLKSYPIQSNSWAEKGKNTYMIIIQTHRVCNQQLVRQTWPLPPMCLVHGII